MVKTKKKAAKKAPANAAPAEAPGGKAQLNAAPTEALTEAPAVPEKSLTIADLQALASVIDIAVRRGTFGAGEVTEVGAIFDKLSSFLTDITVQKEAADAAAESAKAGK